LRGVHRIGALRIQAGGVEVHLCHLSRQSAIRLFFLLRPHTSIKTRGRVLGKLGSLHVPESGPSERYATCDLWSAESVFLPSQHLRKGHLECLTRRAKRMRSLRREVLGRSSESERAWIRRGQDVQSVRGYRRDTPALAARCASS
jgi:hypothetical protein